MSRDRLGRFDEFGHGFGVFQHRQGLLEGFESLRTHQDGPLVFRFM